MLTFFTIISNRNSIKNCFLETNNVYVNNFGITVKPVLSGHSKIDKTKVLKTNGSLMTVQNIAECSLGAFYNSFDLH